MAKRPLHCDVCAEITEHLVDKSDDDGDDLALCSQCGRLQPLPREDNQTQPAAAPTSPATASPPLNSRTR